MIDEKKLRVKLAELLKRATYRSLHTFAHEHFINDVVNAAKECEEPTTTPELLVGSEEDEEE